MSASALKDFLESVLPLAAAAVTSICVGAAIVATRFVIDQSGPMSLALLRYLIGFCCLIPFVLSSVHVRFDRRDLLPIALLGIMQFGILIALLNYAVEFIPSARAALIFATMPLLTMIFASALGRERLTAYKTLGILLSIVGLAFSLNGKAFEHDLQAQQWTGDVAALGSALSGAVCAVLYRPYLRKYPTIQLSACAMLASVGFLALFATREGFFTRFPHFTTEGWLAVLFIGVSSGAGYYLWLWALNHTTPTRVSVFLALSPITAAVLGTALLAERISVTSMVGFACVAIALCLASSREPNAPPLSLDRPK